MATGIVPVYTILVNLTALQTYSKKAHRQESRQRADAGQRDENEMARALDYPSWKKHFCGWRWNQMGACMYRSPLW